jgi:hypothetical protein
MKFVCPLPSLWNEVYQRLHSAWLKDGSNGSPPPVPLILSGWAFSNDLEKKKRWESTVKWASERDFEDLIPEIEESQSHMVTKLSTYEVGPEAGPTYLKRDSPPKTTPSAEEAESALHLLITNWKEIAGLELASHTKPLKFTGKRRRRLLVLADPKYIPPWGSWSELKPGHGRRSFTRLRKRVNEIINPLMVDHVDFMLSSEPFE